VDIESCQGFVYSLNLPESTMVVSILASIVVADVFDFAIIVVAFQVSGESSAGAILRIIIFPIWV